MKKVVSFLLVVLFVSLVLNVSVLAEELEPVTLDIMFFNDKPAHMDEVLEEFYRRTEDTLNIKLNIQWNTVPDHKQKLLLAAASGKEVDLVFDAPWMHIERLAKDGFYTDLEKYFLNDEYPGLKKSYSENYLDYNRFYGKIYAMPITQTMDSMEGLIIRKDLMEKYGFEEIKTYEKLQEFFDTILENEPDMVPLAAEGRAGFFRFFPRYIGQDNIFILNNNFDKFYIALNEDNTEVLGVYKDGDPAEEIKNFPSPWNTTEKWNEKYVKYAEWNKYLEKDVLSQTDPDSLFSAGKAAALNRGFNNLQVVRNLQKIVPEAEVYTFTYRKGDRLRLPDSKHITYQVWNFAAVPVTSKNPDRVMKFIDWLFQSKENHDLFEYGIEGKHWIAVGDDKYKIPEDLNQQYVFPWYQLTGHPDMVRYAESYPQEWIELNKWSSSEERNALSPLAGFAFDYSSVRTEKASVDAIYSKIESGLMTGAYDDPVEVLRKANEQAYQAGLDRIKEEFAKQVQEFLDSKN